MAGENRREHGESASSVSPVFAGFRRHIGSEVGAAGAESVAIGSSVHDLSGVSSLSARALKIG
jgi:hypothetical protein